MDKEEKVRFILEQMRLGLARKDYIRTQIISKKISTKFFVSDSDLVQVSIAHSTLSVTYTATYSATYCTTAPLVWDVYCTSHFINSPLF